MKKIGIAALLALLCSTDAFAQQHVLHGLGGASSVFVWKDKKSQGEAMSLIQAGVHKTNPALLMPLIACIVPDGTTAIITDAGFATHDIMVISGQFTGCRGNVPMEAVK